MKKQDLDQWARVAVRNSFIRALAGLASLAAAEAKLQARRLERLKKNAA